MTAARDFGVLVIGLAIGISLAYLYHRYLMQ